ncbi:hypothetical protein F9C07_2280954 [Aspergillus flavus]|uniref:Uncharacterized protein n=1 Tax=Aspergillus flavus (strain ATCC 200026 / FGSC A1120 / IAM 13836 / NRRL 3357 / JCM 12722 / SRRC 167) TaxID=332952 RepID=A0A7U2MXL0_ASPFN|nr:hypothetical protein F9C07_2280954 [Aspergillus flavus]
MRHIDNAHRSDCHRYISSLVGGEKQGWEYLIRATNRSFGDLRRGEIWALEVQMEDEIQRAETEGTG